jgi:spore maturation protein CgeB
MNDFFLSIVKHGGYDLVWIVMLRDEFMPEVLCEAKRYSLLLAWNSDDDVRWDEYSSKWCPNFSFMITTYRHIYEAYKNTHPNLILAQWGCTGRYDGWNVKKDIDFSFVGRLYPQRRKQIEAIGRRLPIVAYGKEERSGRRTELSNWAKKIFGLSPVAGDALSDEAAIKEIWNRSKLSYTPLDAWDGSHLQVKARVFDMGLSGTVMLCSTNPSLYEFYEPGKEFWEYQDLDDCLSKAKYLLAHDHERHEIASAYYARTKADHMWSYRFDKIFHEVGLPL